MKFKFGVPFLVIILVASACSEKQSTKRDYPVVQNPKYGIYQDYETPPFQFELIDSILVQTPDNSLIASINSLIIDPQGNIYFMDRQQWKLVSVAADGEFRWMTGQEGKGPGDFENVYSMVTDGKNILVGNISGSRMDKFDFSGNFIKSIPMPKDLVFASLSKFTDDNLLVVTSTVWASFAEKVNYIELLEDSVAIKSQFVIDNSAGIEIPDGLSAGPDLKVHGNKVISGSLTDYSLTFFNSDSTIEKKITREFDKNTKPGLYSSGGTRSIRMFGGVDAPIIFPNGYMLVKALWPANIPDSDKYMEKSMNDAKLPEIIWKNSLDFYSPQGKLLYSIENDSRNPAIGNIQHVDENGIIYTTNSGPEPVIYRYKLNVPEAL